MDVSLPYCYMRYENGELHMGSTENKKVQLGDTVSKKCFILMMIFVIGGIAGFIYEEIFYLIDLGYLVKRGITFGPWIPIYGFGSVFIVLTTCKLKKQPIVLFLASMLIAGTIEGLTGLVLHKVFQIRLWDYNVEIWNWLNIGGYVCLRSVLLFGIAGVLLQYLVYPFLEKFAGKCQYKLLEIVATVPAFLFAGDIILSLLL